MTNLFQDARFAFRLFRRHPAPVLIAVGGLATAIAVVTAIFAVIDATMLRPYGMDDPSSVVTAVPSGRAIWGGFPYSRVLEMRGASSVTGVEASFVDQVRARVSSDQTQDRRRYVLFVSGGYLGLLGGRPMLGRSLGPADDRPGAEPVAVVSERFWKTELGGESGAVGARLWINGTPVTIVGVLQPGFTGPENTRPPVWLPIAAYDDVGLGPAFGVDTDKPVKVVARLAPHAGPELAARDLTARLARATPATDRAATQPPLRVIVYRAATPIDGPSNGDQWIAVAAVGGIGLLILALACANTANLLMAASVTRAREIGVRLALGASRRRLILQMLHESLFLGGVAGIVGFTLALWLAPVVARLVQVSPDLDLHPDFLVLGFAVVVALASGVGAGLSPARHGARGHVAAALQGASGVAAGGRTRLRTSFVGFQAAASTLLLVLAVLLARTTIVMTAVDPGFDADHLLVVSPTPLRQGIDPWTYAANAKEALRAMPSVLGVSVTEFEPFGSSRWTDRFTSGGRSFELRGSFTDAEFFSTAGVRLIAGRPFTNDEARQEAPVALVSASVAHAFFEGENPVGQSLARVPASRNRHQPPDTIVGVVADAMMDGPESEVFGAIYRPIRHKTAQAFTDQGFSIPPSLLVRVAGMGTSPNALEQTLARVDSNVRVEVTPIRERLDYYLDARRTFVWMVGPVALLSVLLAGLGMYGVTAFATAQRAHEISIRMAIGASAGAVLRLMVGQSFRPIGVGVAAGAFVALVTSQLLSRQFMIAGISAHDPASIAVALGTIVGLGLVAVILPSRRATRQNPVTLLRQA